MTEDCPEPMNHINSTMNFIANYRHYHLPNGKILARWREGTGRGNVLLFSIKTLSTWGPWGIEQGLAIDSEDVDTAYEAWKAVLTSDDD